MKQVNLFFFFLLLSFAIAGCTPSESAVQTAIAQTQSFYTSTPTNTPTQTETPTPIVTEEPIPMANTSAIKQLSSIYRTISIPSYCELTVQEIKFSRKILPPDTSGYYTYYEAKDPNSTFMDIIATVRNLDTIMQSAENLVSISIIYDNQYNYYAEPIVVDGDGSFTYASISGVSPLLSKTVHYLITVPNQVEYSSKSIEIVLNSSDQEYRYKYR